MNANGFDDTAHELLRAAERSLFDATVRLEEAVAAMDGRRPADANAVLAQARRWSELIAAGLERISPQQLPPAKAVQARRSVSKPRGKYVECATVAKA